MIGRILGNRYEIIELIGSGGMANVYKARCRLLNRFVAVKVLKPEYKNDQEFIRRFDTESQAAASLSHKNIVSIYDVGAQDDMHYIVMEFIEGITLKKMIQEKGALYWKEALAFSMQIAEALEHAHSKHIVHRDIKPQNIMVTPDGQIKVMDFGIARAVTASTTKLGDTALGSAHYISPEQARGGYTDSRTDIYSFGILMYELFTGKLPFNADSPVAVAMQHVQKQPQSPAALNPAIPAAVVAIIMKAINKEQRLRYESASLMLEDLKAAYIDPEISFSNQADDEDMFATRKMQKIEEVWEGESLAESMPRRTQLKKKKRQEDRVAIIAAIITSVVLIVLAGIVLGILLSGGGSASEDIVPNLVGMDWEEAQSKYPNYQIIREGTDYDDTYEAGQIISQDPDAKSKAKGVEVIRVIVSVGTETFELDDYSNMNHMQAKTAINNLGLYVVKVEEENNAYDTDVVIRQSPAAGSLVRKGDTITLYVSLGQEETSTIVPTLLNMTTDRARILLEDNDLKLGRVTPIDSDVESGLIVSQTVIAGTSVEPGTIVDVFISTGRSPATDEPTEAPVEDGEDAGNEPTE